MADDLFELKGLIMGAVAQATTALEVERGLRRVRTAAPEGLPDVSEEAQDFGTGYDSGTGTSVVPFILDYSVLYGDGTSGDKLFG